ncbi:MAG: rhodanese-like domain-containing protein [Candidatus Marinamargulisbacteria bacterium]
MIQCLIIALCLIFTGCKKAPTTPLPHQTNLSPGLAHNLMLQQLDNKSFQIVDVRTLSEFNDGHLAYAQHIDVTNNQPLLLSLNKDTTYLIYCRSGRRSQIAIDYLKKNGYSKLFHLSGGLIAWDKMFNTRQPSPLNEY